MEVVAYCGNGRRGCIVDQHCVNCGEQCCYDIARSTTMPMRDECVGVVRCSDSSGSRMRMRTTTTTMMRMGKMDVVCATIVEQYVIILVMPPITPATRVGCVLFLCGGDVVGVASVDCGTLIQLAF